MKSWEFDCWVLLFNSNHIVEFRQVKHSSMTQKCHVYSTMYNIIAPLANRFYQELIFHNVWLMCIGTRLAHFLVYAFSCSAPFCVEPIPQLICVKKIIKQFKISMTCIANSWCSTNITNWILNVKQYWSGIESKWQ